MTSPEGIEPPSQEPESYVISITLRRQQRYYYNNIRLEKEMFFLIVQAYVLDTPSPLNQN